ncbi:hypothetical protein F4780DRAFT_610724 [Xylariomycetidae sp. FL0641]|nr:hypothetical protein F4780DRAFT_610724 [Xylariomycetidae sp. FL0641]
MRRPLPFSSSLHRHCHHTSRLTMMSGQPAQQTEGVVDVIEPAGPHEYRLEGDTNEKATTGGHGEEGSAPPKALPTAFIRQEGPATPPQAVTHNQPKIVEEEGSSQMVTPLNRLTGTITWIDCPFCRRRTQTRVTKEGTSMQTNRVLSLLPLLGLRSVPRRLVRGHAHLL